MLRKFSLMLFSLSIFIIFQPLGAQAADSRFVIHELYDPGNIVTSVTYDGSGTNDRIFLGVTGRDAQRVYFASHTESWSILTEKNFVPSDYGWEYFEGMSFSCNTRYIGELKDVMGNVLVRIKMTVTGLERPVCASDGNGSNPPPEEPENPEEEPEEPIGEGVCATAICKCIAELKGPIQEVKGSVDTSNIQLEQLNNTSVQIKDAINTQMSQLNQTSVEIRDGIYDLTSEFQTDADYSVSPMPDVSNQLEKNKPIQNETPFIDNNIYFTDQGDAADPGKLPIGPDIKDWDGFKPELPMPPDTPLQEDLEMKTDVENNPDLEMKMDNELIPDAFKPDVEMKKDVMEIEPVRGVDTFTKTEEYNEMNKMNQNMFFEQTNQFSESGGN